MRYRSLWTMVHPKFTPMYPFPWTDPQTPLPASSLDPSIRIRSAVFSQCTGQTDRSTDWPTDHSRDSLMTIGCYATRVMWPNNKPNWCLSCFMYQVYVLWSALKVLLRHYVSTHSWPVCHCMVPLDHGHEQMRRGNSKCVTGFVCRVCWGGQSSCICC